MTSLEVHHVDMSPHVWPTVEPFTAPLATLKLWLTVQILVLLENSSLLKLLPTGGTGERTLHLISIAIIHFKENDILSLKLGQ